MIGADREASTGRRTASEFKERWKIGLDLPRSGSPTPWRRRASYRDEIGLTLSAIIRPGLHARRLRRRHRLQPEEFEEICKRGLDLSR
jgi:carbamoylphosphate synthase large subunit